MKKLAVLSSGFLRNYRFFSKSSFYKYIVNNFDTDVYIGTWEEDGYGSNSTLDYTSNKIESSDLKKDFGLNLKFLKMNSFSKTKEKFKYSPVRNLLRGEPHVLEKYRSKYFCLSEIEIKEEYDVYLHIRFDVFMDENLSKELILKIANFRGDKVYTSRDVYERPHCVGDIFQIGSYDYIKKLQEFYNELYSEKYLDKNIHRVPERILFDYFLDLNLNFEPISCQSKIIRTKCPINDKDFESIWEWWHNDEFKTLWEFKKHEIFGNYIENENPDQNFWKLDQNKMLIFNKEKKLTSELNKIQEDVYSGFLIDDNSVKFTIKKLTRNIDYSGIK